MKLSKKEVLLVILILLVPIAYSYTGSGGTYTINVGEKSQLGAYNGSGGTYMTRIIMGQVAVGEGIGGDFDVWLGYIHTLNPNTIPAISAIAVHTNESDSLAKAYTNSTLICEVNSSDTDGTGQNLEVNVTWYKNGVKWATSNQTFTTTLSGTTEYRINTTTGIINPADTAHEQTWKCSAKVSDGTETSTWSNSSGFYIYNAAPTLDSTEATVITWSEDTTKELDIGAYFTDIDADTLGYYIEYESETYGGGRFNGNDITITINNDTGIISLAPKANVNGLMNIIFAASDGYAANDRGHTNTSNMILNITGVNDAPWATDAYIYPNSPEPTDTLSCEYTYNDLEGDAENTGAAAYKWYLKTEGFGPYVLVGSETGKALTSDNFGLNDVLMCSVKVKDVQGLFATAYTNSTSNRIVSASEESVEANIVIGIG